MWLSNWTVLALILDPLCPRMSIGVTATPLSIAPPGNKLQSRNITLTCACSLSDWLDCLVCLALGPLVLTIRPPTETALFRTGLRLVTACSSADPFELEGFSIMSIELRLIPKETLLSIGPLVPVHRPIRRPILKFP